MGWLFSVKLHLLINHNSQIVMFRIMDGSRDNRKPLEDGRLPPFFSTSRSSAGPVAEQGLAKMPQGWG